MFRQKGQVNIPGWVYIFLALVFVVVLIRILIIPEPLGLADNHDFWRLMDPFGLTYQSGDANNFFSFITLVFDRSAHFHWEIISSGLIFVAIAYIVSALFSAHAFAIIWLGALYILVYSVVYYFFLQQVQMKQVWHLLLYAMLATITLTDVLFTAYFNSFYQEPVIFIFLLLFVVLLLSKKKFFWLEALVLVLVALSKISTIFFLLLFIPLLWKYREQHLLRKFAVAVVSVVLVLLVQGNNQDSAQSSNVFDSFFYGIVTTENASQILADFELTNPMYQQYIGKNFWNAPAFDSSIKTDFFAKVTYRKIIYYYITHPAILGDTIARVFHELALHARPVDLGNRTRQFSSALMVENNTMALWQYIFPFIFGLGLFWSWVQIYVFCTYKHFSTLNILLMTFAVLFPILIAANFLGDGWQDFPKHNVTVYFSFVLWFLLSLQFWYKQYAVKQV